MTGEKKVQPELFHGYDWSELLIRRGFTYDCKTEEEDLDRFRRYLWATHETDPTVERDCRVYLKAVIKADCSYLKPLYKGLAKIKHRSTFIQVFIELLPLLWT